MSKGNGRIIPAEFMSISNRKAFIGTAGTLLLAACGGSALPVLSGSTKGSASKPDCSNPLLANRTGPQTNCVTGPGAGLPTNLSGLTAGEVAAITAEQIAVLESAQIASFTNSQLHYITQAQAFNGAQATAIFKRVAAVGQVLPVPVCWTGTEATGNCGPPPAYIPPNPGSNFWSWFGAAIGGAVGSAVGTVATGPAGFFVGVAGSTAGAALGAYLFGPTDAVYCFYDSNNGEWMGVDLGPASNFISTTENGNTGQSTLDTDGYQIQGTFDASTNTVTVTAVPN